VLGDIDMIYQWDSEALSQWGAGHIIVWASSVAEARAKVLADAAVSWPCKLKEIEVDIQGEPEEVNGTIFLLGSA
jgi:hypothetical protein